MKTMMILSVLLLSQISMAATQTSVATVDLTRIPNQPVFVGDGLELVFQKSIEASKIVFDGYDKQYVCMGTTHDGVDGEVECDVNETLTWVPRAKLLGVKETLRTQLTTQTGSDGRVSTSTADHNLPSTCIRNYESYRYIGTAAPHDANLTLTIDANCASSILDNEIVYFENAKALKGNFLSASLYRSGLLKLNLAQPLQLRLNTPVTLTSAPTIEMRAAQAGDYPALSVLAMTADKKDFLFGNYLYPTLNDKK